MTSVSTDGARTSHIVSLRTSPAQQNVNVPVQLKPRVAQQLAGTNLGLANPIAISHPDLYDRLSSTRNYLNVRLLFQDSLIPSP